MCLCFGAEGGRGTGAMNYVKSRMRPILVWQELETSGKGRDCEKEDDGLYIR